MILKMRVVRHHLKHVYGWEFISDITSFIYSKIEKEEIDAKKGINSYEQSVDKKGVVDKLNNQYVFIQAWHKRSDTPINIVTNLVVYMLTDEGKTIERIN